jgi:hypothetical protein
MLDATDVEKILMDPQAPLCESEDTRLIIERLEYFCDTGTGCCYKYQNFTSCFYDKLTKLAQQKNISADALLNTMDNILKSCGHKFVDLPQQTDGQLKPKPGCVSTPNGTTVCINWAELAQAMANLNISAAAKVAVPTPGVSVPHLSPFVEPFMVATTPVAIEQLNTEYPLTQVSNCIEIFYQVTSCQGPSPDICACIRDGKSALNANNCSIMWLSTMIDTQERTSCPPSPTR